MRIAAIALFAGLVWFAGPALAADCQTETAALDAYLASQPAGISAEINEQASNLLQIAADDCTSGAEDASLEVIAQVKALLGL